MGTENPDVGLQRNALAPGLIAAAVLFLAPVLFGVGWGLLVLFVTAILALIMAWYAAQARAWVWLPLFLAIAVLWNPVYPFAFSGAWWTGAQVAAALVFIAGAAFIRSPRA